MSRIDHSARMSLYPVPKRARVKRRREWYRSSLEDRGLLRFAGDGG